jgi:hypothetical protein
MSQFDRSLIYDVDATLAHVRSGVQLSDFDWRPLMEQRPHSWGQVRDAMIAWSYKHRGNDARNSNSTDRRNAATGASSQVVDASAPVFRRR